MRGLRVWSYGVVAGDILKTSSVVIRPICVIRVPIPFLRDATKVTSFVYIVQYVCRLIPLVDFLFFVVEVIEFALSFRTFIGGYSIHAQHDSRESTVGFAT